MESEKNDEMIRKAITKPMEEEEIKGKTSLSHESNEAVDDVEKAGGGDHHRRRHLSNLLSQCQIESSKEDSNNSSVSKEEAIVEDPLSSEADEDKETQNEAGNAEIIKELKNIKRQNTITQCLLTAMIVITLAWQLSEVSLIFKIKDGLSNPMKSVGGIIKGFFKRGHEVNVQDVMRNASEMQEQVMGPTSIPGMKIPELQHLGLPGFDTSDDEE